MPRRSPDGDSSTTVIDAGPILVTRALVVADPWIGLILDGTKDWEMRTRPTSVRGWVGLVRKGSGTVVGVTRVTGSLPPLDASSYASHVGRHGIGPDRAAMALGGGWVHPWVLEGAVRLTRPVPYAHPRGAVVWVNLDGRVVEEVAAALPSGVLA